MKRYSTLQELSSVLQDMKYFGLNKHDIDEDGYVTLYHGGKQLPKKLRKNEIFFMPKTKWIVLDLVIHSENKAQFKFKAGWYDANSVIDYEFKK